MALFEDRVDAGKKLAKELSKYANRSDVLILALPRGGVPVAFEVAKELNVKMDVFIVRKLGVPGNEELAMGAISSDNVLVLNEDIVKSFQIPERVINMVAENELKELKRRERTYRGDRPKPEISGSTVILVDDGLATGATMRAAASAIKTKNPAKIVVAVPTGAPDTCEIFKKEVDEVICMATPEPFYGVGAWYGNFSQTTDEDVCELLDKARALPAR
ncbi:MULTISPECIES: phosphoribosyltransferase [Methanosarcina]|uniref:Phosphoribosyl transferase domain protein n=3 Tax=Methanosarcina barkeri TaxID=2208 RepID=A0A0E3LMS3_METBA|nr:MULTISPECIES: phosphoribosyltransferase [Methanosarcina]AKB53521.1 Phosphoribosyl transferase domain protein [Methanosarcina barkeri MS]AKB58370.1 Phosphoribosyl transferase domain protein [Methanosarcina barkeri 227]AKJ39160.1 phosphoribosyltransferase [Methanosarcina barkeri CM1]OEC92795.1 phosphoribosyl transferase [Methanosarcina sp. A14]